MSIIDNISFINMLIIIIKTFIIVISLEGQEEDIKINFIN